MKCVPIKDGILCVSEPTFVCPHCKQGYIDIHDKYLDRINNNKSLMTKVRCPACFKKFNLTYDIKGDFVTW